MTLSYCHDNGVTIQDCLSSRWILVGSDDQVKIPVLEKAVTDIGDTTFVEDIVAFGKLLTWLTQPVTDKRSAVKRALGKRRRGDGPAGSDGGARMKRQNTGRPVVRGAASSSSSRADASPDTANGSTSGPESGFAGAADGNEEIAVM